jgi:AcrR family transcriptional regulator
VSTVTPPPQQVAGPPRLRADAARNREQILAAARTAFRELGTAAPLDEIARRAGVNIATLYRRFPDREALVRQVIVDGHHVVLDAARRAREIAPAEPLAAIEQLLMDIIKERDTLVLPLIGGPVTDDAEAVELQRQNAACMEEILAIARAQGAIREDANAVDIIAAGAMACRPMPHIPSEQAAAIAARHVRIFVDGLRPAPGRPLPAASPTAEELFAHLRPTERPAG